MKQFLLILFAVALIPAMVSCSKSKTEKNKNSKISTLQDLHGKKAASLTGSSFQEDAEKVAPKVKITPLFFNDTALCVQAVLSGKADAVFLDEPMARLWIARYPDKLYAGEVYVKDAYSFAIRKNSPLTARISRIIEQLEKSGELEKFKQKWCGSTDPNRKLEKWTHKKDFDGSAGVLTYATDFTQEPMSFSLNGQYVGMDIEVISRVAYELNMKLEITSMNFGSLLEALMSKKVEVVGGSMSITPSRLEKVDFVTSYYQGGQTIVARYPENSAPGGKTEKLDLSKPGTRIGVPEGAVAMTVAEKKYPKAKIVYFNSLSEGYLAVQSKKIDAFLFDRNCMEYVALSNPKHLALLDEKIADESIVIGMPIKHAQLCSEVNAFIKQYRSDGTYDAMYKRWCQSSNLPALPDIPKPAKPTRKLIVGTEGLNPPMSFFDAKGKLSGFDIEFTRRLALYLNAEIELKHMPYPALLSSMETGKINLLISNLNATPERSEKVQFSDCYVDSCIAALVHRDNYRPADVTIEKVTDLAGKKVGVRAAGTLPLLADKFVKGVNYVYFSEYTDAVQALLVGKIDAVLIDEPIATCFVNQKPKQLKIASIFVDDEYGFALPKNSPLLARASAVVKKMEKAGDLAKLKAKWCGTNPAKKVLEDWSKQIPHTGKNGVLRFSSPTLDEPLCYINDKQQVVGYEKDVINRIAAELDMKLEFTDIAPSARMETIASGKADISGGSISITPERKEKVDFLPAHYKGGVAILVPQNVKKQSDKQPFSVKVKQFFSELKDSFDRTFIRESRWRLVLDGLFITVIITLAAAVLGTVLAFPVWLLRTAKNKFAQVCGKIFIYVMQGTPILVLLMVLYYLIFASVDIHAVIVAIIGFSLNFAAYAGEMLRTGIDSIPKGQREAALALGFNRFQTFRKVILPQALRQILPIYRGEFINMLKSTSVVGYIAIQDLTKISDIIRSRTYEAFFPLLATALIYFVTAWFLASFLGWLDNRLDPVKRRRKKLEAEK